MARFFFNSLNSISTTHSAPAHLQMMMIVLTDTDTGSWTTDDLYLHFRFLIKSFHSLSPLLPISSSNPSLHQTFSFLLLSTKQQHLIFTCVRSQISILVLLPSTSKKPSAVSSDLHLQHFSFYFSSFSFYCLQVLLCNLCTSFSGKLCLAFCILFSDSVCNSPFLKHQKLPPKPLSNVHFFLEETSLAFLLLLCFFFYLQQ